MNRLDDKPADRIKLEPLTLMAPCPPDPAEDDAPC